MKLLPGHHCNAHLIEANLSHPFNFQSLQDFQLQGALPLTPLCVLVDSKHMLTVSNTSKTAKIIKGEYYLALRR